jgi:hypothetical protein
MSLRRGPWSSHPAGVARAVLAAEPGVSPARGAPSVGSAAVRLLVLVWVAAGCLTVAAARACIAVGQYSGSIGIPLVERYS